MGIRKIKNKERENGMRYCTFCKPVRVNAIWRDWRNSYSCENHKSKLDAGDDGHMTEADYQTWGRLQ